jgi:hypothetical protein
MQGAESTLPRHDVLSDGAIILPSQYFGSIGSVGLSAEQRLMLAVLVDAINVLQTRHDGGSTCKRCNFAEAAQWVNTQGSRYLFSFDGVCDALDIDSELLRSGLRVLTSPSANSASHTWLGRQRFRKTIRSPHMTANRSRRREHRSHVLTALVRRTSAPSSCWDEYAE